MERMDTGHIYPPMYFRNMRQGFVATLAGDMPINRMLFAGKKKFSHFRNSLSLCRAIQ